MQLTVTDAWRTAYPAASAGVLVMRNVTNPVTAPALDERKTELEQMLRARCADRQSDWVKTDPVLSAYQAYYRRFKKTYHVAHQVRSVACEGKLIPNRAALVEAMFMAELATGLLTAGHDLAALNGEPRLDVATGDEVYVLLGGAEQTTKPGDMLIADAAGVISSVIYGPDQRTAIRPETTEVIFTTYAPVGVDRDMVREHLSEIERNVRLIAPEAEVEISEIVPA